MPATPSAPDGLASRILRIAEDLGALRYGQFRLSAGGTSGFYFDGRVLTLDPEGGCLVARAMLALARASGAEAIAGPTLGADPMVASVATLSHLEGPPLPGLIVRQSAKGHGTGRQIEGTVRGGMRVAVVDDTCTSGRSLLAAVDALTGAGCEITAVMCVLDRREGGADAVAARGLPFSALLEAGPDGRIRPRRGPAGG